jgi:hypothetical protein
MPGIRLLAQSPLPPPRRRVTALERAYTIRLRYLALARELGYAVRFQTARSRRYRDWQGQERDEAAVLLVGVIPDGATPRALGSG